MLYDEATHKINNLASALLAGLSFVVIENKPMKSWEIKIVKPGTPEPYSINVHLKNSGSGTSIAESTMTSTVLRSNSFRMIETSNMLIQASVFADCIEDVIRDVT